MKQEENEKKIEYNGSKGTVTHINIISVQGLP
jgi:hypothetical protein